MSSPYVGNYTANLYSPDKRYRLSSGNLGPAGGFQRGVSLCDSELREISDSIDTSLRLYIAANIPGLGSTNNGFKIVQSASDTANNFTIMGGEGTVMDVGNLVLFTGLYSPHFIFAKSNFEYKDQGSTGALTDDNYTKTTIPTLTTPEISNRTDEVYIDFYLAEVSSNTGSEYRDTSLQVSGIGASTANRARMVWDVRVSQGDITPTNGNDANGIYHVYTKIATLNRINSANILTSMIVDNRVKINSVQSLSLGTPITNIILPNQSSVGDYSHRVGTIYTSGFGQTPSYYSFPNNASLNQFNSTTGYLGIGTASASCALDIRLNGGDLNAESEGTCQNWGVSRKPFFPLLKPQTLNISSVSTNLYGFGRGCSDGRYIYLPPYRSTAYHGKLTRIDTNNFTTGGTTVLDLSTINANYVGYKKCLTDGKFLYLLPLVNTLGEHGNLIRVDLQNFAVGGVTVIDLASINANFISCMGGCIVGSYLFIITSRVGTDPNKSCYIIKVDLNNFSAGGVTSTVDLEPYYSHYYSGYSDLFSDGNKLWGAPFINPSIGAEFGVAVAVNVNNLSSIGSISLESVNSTLRGFTSGFFDGRYNYYIGDRQSAGVYSGNIARVDMNDYSNSSWISLKSINVDWKYFDGGAIYDGRYFYVFTSHESTSRIHRIDSNDFSASGVTTIDHTAYDATITQMNAGCYDGKYIYTFPCSSNCKLTRTLVSVGGPLN